MLPLVAFKKWPCVGGLGRARVAPLVCIWHVIWGYVGGSGSERPLRGQRRRLAVFRRHDQRGALKPPKMAPPGLGIARNMGNRGADAATGIPEPVSLSRSVHMSTAFIRTSGGHPLQALRASQHSHYRHFLDQAIYILSSEFPWRPTKGGVGIQRTKGDASACLQGCSAALGSVVCLFVCLFHGLRKP